MHTISEKPHPKSYSHSHSPTLPIKLPSSSPPSNSPSPIYRRRIPPPEYPESPRKRCSMGCCCMCLFWTTIVTVTFLVVAAMAAISLYGYYRPRSPSFSLSSLKFTHLNLSAASAGINLTIAASNPNQKITFFYDPINVTVVAHHGEIVIGEGYFPQFTLWGKNTTALFTQIESSGDNGGDDRDEDFQVMKLDLKSNKGMNLRVEMVTQMRFKIGGSAKVGEFGLQASCFGINAFVSNNHNLINESTVETRVQPGAKCDVRFIFTIFEWQIPFGFHS